MRIQFSDQDFFPNFYERLGIERDASAPEIARAYKKRAMETHPDRHLDDQENATKQFVAVGRAYEILKDPDHKLMYDRALQGRTHQTNFTDDRKNSEKTDYTNPEFYKDFMYTADEVQRYKEASERMASGQYRSGDLSTVFNFLAKPPGDLKTVPRLSEPRKLLE